MRDPNDFYLYGPQHRVRARGSVARLDDELSRGPAAAGHALDLLRGVEAERGEAGIIVGAIPFDPSRPARFHVPESVDWNAPLAEPRPQRLRAGSTPRVDDVNYRAGVASALRGIDAGLLRKVVLARSIDLLGDELIDIDDVFASLDRAKGSGYSFRVGLGTDGTLIGASPELVVSVSGSQLRSHPLAGSVPRGTGPADELARDTLLASAKDRGEHALLVTALRSGLAPFTTELSVPAEPSVLATEQLWHLGTAISGQLLPGCTALDVAYAVHPTPAVCGVPQHVAADLVRILEPVDRGFYAGLVGWMNSAGEGEWVLALRCGLVNGARIRVHAGAGVVAGSTPDGEHAETAVKFGTVMAALARVPGLEVAPVPEALVAVSA